jgi:hypothetical protein
MIRFNYKRLALALVALTILAGLHGVTAQMREGAIPYAPTRIEWLCLELNASLAEPLTGGREFSMDFTHADDDPDTLIIYVRYLPTVQRDVMNLAIDGAKNVIEIKKRQRRWTWLNVREQVMRIELPRR